MLAAEGAALRRLACSLKGLGKALDQGLHRVHSCDWFNRQPHEFALGIRIALGVSTGSERRALGGAAGFV